MEEPTQGGAIPEGISRREIMQRGAFVAGAAALWATPMVQTLGQRPAAAQTPEVADFCPVGEGRITSMDISYTGQGCGHVSPPDAAAGDSCTQHVAGPLPDPAFIVVTRGNCGGGGSGDETSAAMRDVGEVFDSGLSPSGNQACLTMQVYDEENGTLLVTQVIHTSCSEELNIGEEYGPIRIEGGTWSPN